MIIEKQAITASEFISTNQTWRSLSHSRCCLFIGHVRSATHGGAADINHAHPFSSSDGNLHLIHNGTLLNHQNDAEQMNITLRTECDSELLLRMVERERHPVLGLTKALRCVKGSIAVAVLDCTNRVVYLARNTHRNLWVLRLRDGRMFFASEGSILLAAIRQVWGDRADERIEILMPIASHHVHVLNPGGIVSLDKVA